MNDHLVLVLGKPSTGKSASLSFLTNQESYLYLNCENGKKLPFKAGFKQMVITDPLQVPAAIEKFTGHPKVEGIIIDSLSFLLNMYENQYVVTSTNTQQAWGGYAQFVQNMMQKEVASCDKPIVFTSHVQDKNNEAEMTVETKAVAKGAVGKLGIEAFFSCVIATKKISVKTLKAFAEKNGSSPLLVITPEDEQVGYKHVFQTRITADTVNETIRSPMGMWKVSETYIDNDMQKVFDRLKEFYGE